MYCSVFYYHPGPSHHRLPVDSYIRLQTHLHVVILAQALLHIAVKMILWKRDSDHLSLLPQKSQKSQITSRFLSCFTRLYVISPLVSSFISQPAFTLLPLTLILLVSFQGFCTCYAFFLECSSSQNSCYFIQVSVKYYLFRQAWTDSITIPCFIFLLSTLNKMRLYIYTHTHIYAYICMCYTHIYIYVYIIHIYFIYNFIWLYICKI